MLCRICCDINEKSKLVDIFDERISNASILRLYISLATSVEIKQNDLVSKFVCDKCLQETFTMYQFRTRAIKNDKMLKESAGQLYLPQSIHFDPDAPIELKKQEKVIVSINVLDEKEDLSFRPNSSEDKDNNLGGIPKILQGVGLERNNKTYSYEKVCNDDTISKEFNKKITRSSVKKEIRKTAESDILQNNSNNNHIDITKKLKTKVAKKSFEKVITTKTINNDNSFKVIKKITDTVSDNDINKELAETILTASHIPKSITNMDVAIKIKETITKKTIEEKMKIKTPIEKNVNKRVSRVKTRSSTRKFEMIQNNQNVQRIKKITSLDHPEPTKNLSMDNFEMKPHPSIKELLTIYPGLKLPKELLPCNIKTYIRIETCVISIKNVIHKTPNEFRDSLPLEPTTLDSVKVRSLKMPQVENIKASSTNFTMQIEDPSDKDLLKVWKESVVFNCPLCNQIFSTKKNVARHMCLHYICHFCRRKFNNANCLERHRNNTCPKLMKDFKIELERCDENLRLRIKYKSAFDVYIENEENIVIVDNFDLKVECDKVIENENINAIWSSLNQKTKDIEKKQSVPSPIIVSNKQSTLTLNLQSKKQPLLEPSNETVQEPIQVCMLNNFVIDTCLEPLPKKAKLITESESTNKRTSNHFLTHEKPVKKPRLHTPMKLEIPSPQLTIGTDSLRETILHNYFIMNVDELSKEREEEINFVRSMKHHQGARCRSISTQIESSDTLTGNSIIKEKDGLTVKNMVKEISYHNIPIKFNVTAKINEISAKFDTKIGVNKSTQEIDLNLNRTKTIVIKPLGSREVKLHPSRRTASQTQDKSIIEIEDDNILDLSINGQVSNNGMSITTVPKTQSSIDFMNTTLNKPPNNYSIPVSVKYPHIVLQGNCIARQNLGQTNFLYRGDFRKLINNVPQVSSSLPALINQEMNIPVISSGQATPTLALSNQILINNLLPNKYQYSSNFKNYQVRVPHVQQPDVSNPSPSHRPQIRIKNPSEINNLY